MQDIKVTKNIVGVNKGRVILKNIYIGLAPSREAASYNVVGIPCNPDNKMIIFVPITLHTPTVIIAVNTHFGSVSQLGPSIENQLRTWFIIPYSELYSQAQIIPIAAGIVTTGRKNSVR